MPRGSKPGERRGGRKPGSRNKRTIALISGATDAGLMPLEFMLQRMRNPRVPMAERVDMAKAAAPYLHSRLAPRVEFPGDEKPVGGEMTDADLTLESRLSAYENVIDGKFARKPPPSP